MNSKTSAPYDWLRQLPRSLLQLDQVPIFGTIPPFPWEQLNKTIANAFEIERVTIKTTDSQWRTVNDLYAELPDDLVPLNISIAGIDGAICWVLSKQDILQLSSVVLRTDSGELVGLDSEVEDSFYRFLGFKVIQTIAGLDWDKTLSLHILNNKQLPQEDSFCIDIEASLDDVVTHGRLILTSQFQKSFKRRFSTRSLDRPEFRIPLSEKLESTIHLEIGHTSLKLNEWQSVKKGDFLLLDDCSMRQMGKGHITITLQGVPFLTAEMKEGALQIIERPLQREVNTTMDKEPDDEEFEEFEDEEFEEFEDEKFEEFEDDESFEDEEETLNEESENVEKKPEAAIKEEKKAPDRHTPAKIEKSTDSLATPKDIPMHIVVEVGRLKMSVQKIMELAPGNILDLNLSPEDGVDLTVNGRCIAKGELIKIGDVLGVRILDIG